MINHPLAINTKIRANKPKCACKGGGLELVEGTILKSITNQSGLWYYLNVGVTVKSDWVISII